MITILAQFASVRQGHRAAGRRRPTGGRPRAGRDGGL